MREKRSSTFQGALRPRSFASEYVPDLKVVLLGSEDAGKVGVLLSSFSLANNEQTVSSSKSAELGEEKIGFSIPLVHDGKTFRFSVIDSSSCDQFRAVRDMQIRMGDCFLLVYNSSSWDSFREIEKLCHDIAAAKETEVPVALIANNLVSEREEEEQRKNRRKKKSASYNELRKERRLSDTTEVVSSHHEQRDLVQEKEQEPAFPKRVPKEEGEKLALKLNCRFFSLGSSPPPSPSSSSSPPPYPHITLGRTPQKQSPPDYAPVLKEAFLYLLGSYVSLNKKDKKTCVVM